MAGVRVALHRSAWLAIGRDLVGQRVRATVERHRWALAGGSAELDLWFGEGRRIDPLLATLAEPSGRRIEETPGAARGERLMRLLALVWPELRMPDAETRPFERMLDALDDLSPRVEAVDLGVALVDVTGLGPMWGPERRIAARAVMLARAVAPLRVRCGIGENRWMATLAARLARFERPEAPAAFRILDRDELRRPAPGLLPADAATRQRFGLFGLTRDGASWPTCRAPRSAPSSARSGSGSRPLPAATTRGRSCRAAARSGWRRARDLRAADRRGGRRGPHPASPRRRAVRRLRERHLAPGRAVLTLRLEDAPALRVAQPFPSRRSSRTGSRGCCCHAWRRPRVPGARSRTSHEEPRVASVRLVFDRLADPASRQLPAFEAQAGRWEELRWSLERIRHRFGEGRLWRAALERPTAALPEHRSRLVELDR